MDIIENISDYSSEIKKCIARHGHAPEHNYSYYLSKAELGARNVFLQSGDGYGLLANYREKAGEFMILSEPLAPEEEALRLIMDALDTCFKNLKITKFVVEQDEKAREKTLHALKGTGYKGLDPRYSLFWPVFDMEGWDGDAMQGEKWKNMRNIKNRFYRENKVEAVDTSTIGKDLLKGIISEWVERRRMNSIGTDRKDSNFTYIEPYINLINIGFGEMKFAKTLVVNGVPSTITAGWEIPNSDRAYYSAIGISNYRFEGLSEAANLDDLCRLKQNGYKSVDFGGSPLPLLNFKLKFRPTRTYRTYTYAIIKKN
ncbi:hypothetical protein HYY72_04005 [Candidatus Woesearchaeota archaeon]|nr:hypothetical protein [Candidatus Woesearchaeota archaeon]